MVVPALRPTGYTGLSVSNPRDTFTFRRAPTPKDYSNYFVGDRWIDLAASQAYILVNKAAGIATWQLFGLAASAIDQFTVDLGAPVLGVAGNLNLVGDIAYGLRTSNGGAGVLELQNLRELATYVVDVAGGKEYTSIQAAITQAVADGASVANQKNVYILPGVYTENLTLADGVNLVGFQADGRGLGVVISGTVTHPGGFVLCQKVAFNSLNPVTVDVTAATAGAFLYLDGCSVDNAGGFIGLSSTAINPASIVAQNSNLLGGTIAVELVANAQLVASESALAGTQSLVASGGCLAFISNGETPLGGLRGQFVLNNTAAAVLTNALVVGDMIVNDTAVLTSFRSSIDSAAAIAVTIALGATATMSTNSITSNAGGGFWAAGTGNIFTDGQNALLGTAVAIAGTLTTNVIPVG